MDSQDRRGRLSPTRQTGLDQVDNERRAAGVGKAGPKPRSPRDPAMASGARQVRAEQRVGPGVILTADCIDAMAALEPDSIDATSSKSLTTSSKC